MNRALIICVVVLASFCFISTAIAGNIEQLAGFDKPTNQSDSIILGITREQVAQNDWLWTYSLTNNSNRILTLFSIGLPVSVQGANYSLISTSITGCTVQNVLNGDERFIWSGFALGNKGDATFSFHTTLGGVGEAMHTTMARRYYATFDNGAAPAAVPEPISMVLGIMGLSSVAGMRKLRKA